MIISTDRQIALDKVQHSFMMKPLNKLGNYHNIIKAIYNKSTGNIIMVKIWKLRCRTLDDYIYIYIHNIHMHIYMLLHTHTHTLK